MLHTISWIAFAQAIGLVTGLYYIAVLGLFFRKEVRAFITRRKMLLLLPAATLAATTVFAQDAATGINQANTMIRGIFDTATQLMYAVGGILALVGAVKTFREWNAGHQQEAYRAATSWFGSCIFLVVVATVIKSFFNL